MLAGWQNTLNRFDVNQDGIVTPLDALVVINELSRRQARGVGGALTDRPENSNSPYFDVNGDGHVTAHDALQIINVLSRNPRQLAVTLSLDSTSDPNHNGTVLSPTVQLRGQTSPFAEVTVATATVDLQQELRQPFAEPITVLADRLGNYRLSLELQAGRNRITYSASDELGRTVTGVKELVLGDIATDWNAAVLNVIRDWTTRSDDPYPNRIVPSAPPIVAYNLALIHVAMFDALVGVWGGYNTYQGHSPAPEGASAVAAAATAAYEVARTLYPESQERLVWNATLHESLQGLPDGEAMELGIEYGRQIAATILNSRRGDGSDVTGDYLPGSQPGQWNRTAPNFLPPLIPNWGQVRPLAVPQIENFRPDAPPPLDSEAYAAEVDEVMRLGRLDSPERTAEQTEIARFWVDGPGTATPPGHWNRIAVEFGLAHESSLLENARTLALLNLALADAGIASWDAKYHYDLWRPIDAIRRADEDGNPATVADPHWLPLILTPHFPAYTSGHSTFSAAGAEVLTHLFGDQVAFASRSDTHSGLHGRPLTDSITRQFSSFHHAAQEASDSRIYGGIHYRFDGKAGLESGQAVGQWLVTHWLLPQTQPPSA